VKQIGDKNILLTNNKIIQEPVGHLRSKTTVRILRKECPGVGNVGRIINSLSDRKCDKTVESGVCLISRSGGINYGHFVIERLPMLEGIFNIEDIEDSKIKIIIREDSPEWLWDLLSIVGVQENNIVETDRAIAFEQLFIPNYSWKGSQSTLYDPQAKRWARDRIRESIQFDEDIKEKIWISRENATWRTVVNEKEIHSLVRDHGFTVVTPENMSQKESLSTFAQAELIAGVTGAGFGGVISAMDAHLLIIQPHDYFVRYWVSTAEELGLDYTYMYGENHSRSDGRKDDDVLISKDTLSQTIQSI
jgi:capsular polysaccharide biosynthesis protein